MQMTIQEMTSTQLATQLKIEPNNLFLLDVREDSEVEICAIDGSVHIAMNLVPLYLDRIPDEKRIVIYCHHGVRSLSVANFLIQNGFDEEFIYSLKGGIDDWALTVDKSMARY